MKKNSAIMKDRLRHIGQLPGVADWKRIDRPEIREFQPASTGLNADHAAGGLVPAILVGWWAVCRNDQRKFYAIEYHYAPIPAHRPSGARI